MEPYFCEASFEEEYNNLIDLFVAHQLEVIGQDPLKIDFESYFAMERSGSLKMFLAKRYGAIIGYAIYFISTHMHSGESTASQDAIYILPEHRGFGLRFIRWVDSELKKLKIKRVYMAVRPSFDFSNLLIRAKYEIEEIVFSKELK